MSSSRDVLRTKFISCSDDEGDASLMLKRMIVENEVAKLNVAAESANSNETPTTTRFRENCNEIIENSSCFLDNKPAPPNNCYQKIICKHDCKKNLTKIMRNPSLITNEIVSKEFQESGGIEIR